MISSRETFQVFWSAGIRQSCQSCRTAKAVLFCQPDSVFLCLNCDAGIHGANMVASRHCRHWLCVVCEEATAAVTCHSDAAALCLTCDADIHSPGTRGSGHVRVPIAPFSEWPLASSSYVGGVNYGGHNTTGNFSRGSEGSEIVMSSKDELSSFLDSFLVSDRGGSGQNSGTNEAPVQPPNSVIPVAPLFQHIRTVNEDEKYLFMSCQNCGPCGPNPDRNSAKELAKDYCSETRQTKVLV